MQISTADSKMNEGIAVSEKLLTNFNIYGQGGHLRCWLPEFS